MSKCKTCNNQLNQSIIKYFDTMKYKSCPKCSSINGDYHIFYVYDIDFGFSTRRITNNNPDGIQSYCNRCRSGNFGPHTPHIKCK